jgi:peptidoglycan-associated lipoprotein
MKLFKISFVIALLLFVSACSTLGGKSDEDAMAKGEVSVEDRNAETTGVEGLNPNGEDINAAEAKVIVGEDQYQGTDLNDPASPLSNRVIYFEYDSSAVRAEDQATLEAHAAYLAEHPNVTVRLEGHTDERGAREYNLALGERRAISIRQLLMLQGASVNQFEITSFGEERPAVEGHDEAAWSQNRRVEIIYLGQ